MTKRELEQFRTLNIEIKNDKKRLAELEAAAAGKAVIITGMPLGTSINDTTGRYATELVSLKEKIEHNVERCWKEVNKIREFIDSIDDSLVRQILMLKYVNGFSWSQVATNIGGENSEDTVKQNCHRFLKNLVKK